MQHLIVGFHKLMNRIGSACSVLLGRSYCYSKSEYNFHNIYFSQEGEDAVLNRIFSGKSTGFYVDVGAHHPQRFSNTYCFYMQGWTGINIDPRPGMKQLFDAIRPNDTNLEIGVSSVAGDMPYYAFSEAALNTFDAAIASSRPIDIVSVERVEVQLLSVLLDRYLHSGTCIDFLSIDVEGLDLDVLKSNNWSRYRPRYVLVEALRMQDLTQVTSNPVYAFMKSQSYSLFAKTFNTLFFSRDD